ncbi:uncharacterized protein LOC123500053 [Portunus trituberculatus]|uniref:uncharacterized protein LOC123500053 n=1 Tax=Portunus trituberculatus TaxID=210409 RepID=UPI001E1CBA22|nr:uncharacterized protein LOC123500053 [Portunus trituberculatus]XP_045104611.1 uncharacterized protein LOC123500053 [Portunus trituberculatus]XP_045104612.1 uncharacterized protein LOC123500053 [Portunus trituberculatus]
MLLSSRTNSLEGGHLEVLGDAAASRRVRRSMAAPSFPANTMFMNTTSDIKFRVPGDLPQYLQASDSNTIFTGPHNSSDSRGCFNMHFFDVIGVNGNVVVLESTNQRYITKDSDNSLKLMTGSGPQQTSQSDDRFFSVHMDEGDNALYLKHLHSGKFLSASSSGASLVTSRVDATSFIQFRCNN